jgi:transcriptional regulator with XRE-family HTH domain
MLIEFPSRIRAERLRLGMTQEEAAVALDMSRNTYKHLEDAPRDIRLSTLYRLVQIGYRLEALTPELVQ